MTNIIKKMSEEDYFSKYFDVLHYKFIYDIDYLYIHLTMLVGVENSSTSKLLMDCTYMYVKSNSRNIVKLYLLFNPSR